MLAAERRSAAAFITLHTTQQHVQTVWYEHGVTSATKLCRRFGHAGTNAFSLSLSV